MIAFLIGRLKSFKFSFKGALYVAKNEHSIISQLVISLFVIFLGFYFKISRVEWMMQIFAIGLVVSIETVNTAIEALCDFIHPERHHKIGLIKDIGAGAVMFAATAAVAIAAIIYYPYIF